MCTICEKSYLSYSGVYKHNLSQCQSDCKPFFCNDCNFNTYNQSFLIAHMQKVHADFCDNEYTCDKCEKKFPDILSKINHEAKICRAATLPCKFCSKLNKNSKNLEEHIISFHPEKLENKAAGDIVQEIINEINATSMILFICIK